jgi:hypothetical protein
VKAAKQWTFTPGTKDGAPAPVLITIQIAFRLGSAPLTKWPDAFSPGPHTGAGLSSDVEWTKFSAETAGLHVAGEYPAAWLKRPETDASSLIRVAQTTAHRFQAWEVLRPTPTNFRLDGPLEQARLEQFANRITQTMSTDGRAADVLGTGQLRVGKRIWIWAETWSPTAAAPSAFLSNAPPAFRQVTDGARIWTFITTEGNQSITVACVVALPNGLTLSEKEAETQVAGDTFSQLIKRLSIVR